MKCTYEITINGKRKVFSSSMELDAFLAANFKDYYIDNSTESLHTDLVRETEEKIEEIQRVIGNGQVSKVIINDEGEAEKILIIPKSCGTTKFITTYGSPDDLSRSLANPDNVSGTLVTAFNEEHWERTQRDKLRESGLTDSEINQIIKDTKESWKVLTNLGINIHSIFESILKGTNPDLSEINKLITDDELRNRVINTITTGCQDLLEEIYNKHGRNCKIYSELPIVSKTINEIYTKGVDGITSINGVIDMLVIDENGNAHIYDFKVSRRSIGNWYETDNIRIRDNWSSTKKQSAGYQLALYSAILKQYGINVVSTCIVPFKLDLEYDGVNIKTISAVYLDRESIKYTPNSTKHNVHANQIIPSKTILDEVDLMTSLQEPMTKYFPNYAVEAKISLNTVTVEQYKGNDKIVHRLRAGEYGYGEYKYRVYNRYSKKNVIFCKTDEEMDVEVQKLVTTENAYRGEEFSNIAAALIQVRNNNNSLNPELNITLRDLISGSDNKKEYISKLFDKYIKDGSLWELQQNPAFIAAGLFVFVNNVTKKMEIISLHQSSTHLEVNLGKGTTLLGATKANYEVNEHTTMMATHGNIDLIKVMTLLNSLGSDTLDSYVITKISAHNIWQQTGSETYNEDLFENFKTLCKIHNIPINLKAKHFATTLQSTISQIRDICGEDLYVNIGNFNLTISPDNIVEGSKAILEKMEWLRSNKCRGNEKLKESIISNEWDFSDPISMAYMLLGRALNKLSGYNVYIEADPGMWMGTKFSTGLMINSPGLSPSLNVQTLSQITSLAEAQIRERAQSYKSELKRVFEAFYQYNERNRLLGGEVRYFDNLFERDEQGNIDKRMLLRNPNDPDLSKEEKALIVKLLGIFNRLNGERYTPDDIEYYQVPLAMASRRTKRYRKGFVWEMKDYYVNQLNFLRIFPAQEENYMDATRRSVVYNKYDINQNTRNNILATLDQDDIETNLEDLVWDYIVSYETANVMQEFLPRMQAIKISLQYMHNMFGVDIRNVSKYIDEYLKVNVYKQPIMDEKLVPYYKKLGVVRDIISATSLGFNYRSGIREMVSGIWINLSRSMVNAYGKDQFKKEELIKAWSIIAKESIKDINLMTLVDALNVNYQMANADIDQLKEQLSMSKSGIRNFESDTLFIFSRIPDIYNRMGILVAKMIHDGCWDAHSITEDDELIYDFKKDKRFSLLNDPNADKNSDEYRKQRGLYTTMRLQFNKEGYSLKDGDALPRAYTIQESNSIKSFADMCFGHYDRSSQMLMKHKFLGAFFLQFKTFLSAKAEQWILKPGTYNQGHYEEQYDGEHRIVRIYTFDENGEPSVRIDTENNVQEGEIWEPYMEWTGRFMEGMAYSMLDFGKALYHMDFQKFKELWANPTKRANFKLFLNDMVWMSIIAAIISALLGDNDETVWGHALVVPTIQALGDGNIYTIAKSMVGDINPAIMSQGSKIINNTWDLITGQKSFGKALTGTFGSLNSLKYTIEEATEE